MRPGHLVGSSNSLSLPCKTLNGASTGVPQHGRTSLREEKPTPKRYVCRNRRDETPYSCVQRQNDPERTRRPPNCFILFRKDFVAQRSGDHPLPGKTLSQLASEAWKGLSSVERTRWEKIAHETAEEHDRMHPDYKFSPKRKDRPKGARPSKKPPCQSTQRRGHPDSRPPTVSLQAGDPPPQLVSRRQSLRLKAWEDSVIPPNPLVNNGFDYFPSFLPRRTSSAPLPEPGAVYPLPEFLNKQDPILGALTPVFPNIARHFGAQPVLDTFRETRANVGYANDALQPITSPFDGSPPSFEHYTMEFFPQTFPEPSRLTRQIPSAHYEYPTAHAHPYQGMPPIADFHQWDNAECWIPPSLPPSHASTFAAPRKENLVPPPMQSLQRHPPPMNTSHRQYSAVEHHEEEEVLVRRMSTISVGDVQPLTTAPEKVKHKVSTERKLLSPDIPHEKIFSSLYLKGKPFQPQPSGEQPAPSATMETGQRGPLGMNTENSPLFDELFRAFVEIPRSGC